MNKNRVLKMLIVITACCAAAAFFIPVLSIHFSADEERPLVIVLDPGHGGADVGAVSDDGLLYESDLNLAIALAARDELQRYDNVEVYMTHTGVDYNTTMSLNDRINYVNAVGGDILISLHCNDSENSAASGSEIYVSHSTYSDTYNQKSTELAIQMLRKFSELGMRIRGVKTRYSNGSRMYYHADGTVEVGDYYAVIGGTIKRYGIPGILVEHGFVTGDEAFLSSSDNLTALGIADATAIAEYYGLSLSDTMPETSGSDNEPEAEAIIISDSERISASDVTNRLMSIEYIASSEGYDDLQTLRVDYERLSRAAKTLIEQPLVDELYRTIIQVDAEMRPVRLAVKDDSILNVNRVNHTIAGAEIAQGVLSGTTVAELNDALTIYVDQDNAAFEQKDTTGCFIVVIDEKGFTMDIAAQIGTGTRAQLWQNGILLDELTVVILCDISGDGEIDSLDQYVLEDYIYHDVPLSEAALIAADANLDGYVNEKDIENVVHEILSRELE